MSERYARDITDNHVQPCCREISQNLLDDHFGSNTNREPVHRLARTEYDSALVWNRGMYTMWQSSGCNASWLALTRPPHSAFA
jgi:hypothetical protein